MHGGAALETTGQRRAAWAIIAAGALVRVVLAVKSPRPYGYVYDFYHQSVQVMYATGRLPVAADCAQCYQPPVFTVLGLPFYAVGRWLNHGAGAESAALRWLSVLPVLCGIVCVWYGWRLLVLLGRRGWDLVLGLGLLVTFPCLVISSYGVEADIVLAALMIVFTYYCCSYWRDPEGAGVTGALRLGVIAGLAAATKYNGLVAIAAFIVLLAGHLFVSHRRKALLGPSAPVIGVAVLLSGWTYVDNMRRYDTPLFANGSAQQGFKVGSHHFFFDRYELDTLRVRSLLGLWSDGAPHGALTNLAVYRSVPTTLYAMAWTDMTFFSEPTRSMDFGHPYPRRTMPEWLVAAVLALGLVPTALALVGVAVTWRDRTYLPLVVIGLVTIGVYTLWFLSQETWALKTKYILFLLPPAVNYALVGLARVRRWRWRAPGQVLATLLGLLVVACSAYLMVFAIGPS